MIRIASQPQSATPAWHAGFLAMLPAIVNHAGITFRHLNPEARQDAVAECVANALVAYARLAELGKESLAYPTVLAIYAVRQYRDGRRVGKPTPYGRGRLDRAMGTASTRMLTASLMLHRVNERA